MSALAQLLVVGKQLLGARHVAGRAFQFNVVGTQVDVDVQAVFQHVQILIARAKQGFDIRVKINAFLHSGLWRCLLAAWGPCWDANSVACGSTPVDRRGRAMPRTRFLKRKDCL